MTNQRERFLAAKSIGLRKAVERWMRTNQRAFVDAEIGRQRGKVSKASYSKEDLIKILLRYGLAQSRDAALRVTKEHGIAWLIEPKLLAEKLKGSDIKIKLSKALLAYYRTAAGEIIQETSAGVRRLVAEEIRKALNEDPRPSLSEITGRIYDESKVAYAFSPGRAERIARTETARAENAGTIEGYREAGVQKKRWIAYTDGKSGDRHHEELHNVTIVVGEKFGSYLGNSLDFPGDPSAPIEDTVNCRCAIRAVIDPPKEKK